MKVLKPFGPKIAVTKIPVKIINLINKEVDLIRKDNSINLVHMMTKLLNVVIL